MDQPGKVANPARGQLNRENEYLKKNLNASRLSKHPPVRGAGGVKMFKWDHRLQRLKTSSPFAPENLVSLDGFGSSPVPRQPAHSPYSR